MKKHKTLKETNAGWPLKFKKKFKKTFQEQNYWFSRTKIENFKSLKLNIKVVQYTMYLKHKTCNTKIFIELKNLRTFKNQGWKNTLFQEQIKIK